MAPLNAPWTSGGRSQAPSNSIACTDPPRCVYGTERADISVPRKTIYLGAFHAIGITECGTDNPILDNLNLFRSLPNLLESHMFWELPLERPNTVYLIGSCTYDSENVQVSLGAPRGPYVAAIKNGHNVSRTPYANLDAHKYVKHVRGLSLSCSQSMLHGGNTGSSLKGLFIRDLALRQLIFTHVLCTSKLVGSRPNERGK